MRVRVGIDLIRVSEVEESLLKFGTRYEQRLFTDRERSDATGTVTVRAASLAARFAAKEATIKVLQVENDPPPWKSIEIQRNAHGVPALCLNGVAAQMAADGGLADWSVSLSHDGGMAAAVVAATSDPPER
jgi:holo-[acyl-carrier protein] synthase